MATATASIPDALLIHLTAFAAAQSPTELEIAYPDLPFAPVDGEVYLEATFLPNTTQVFAVASDGVQRHMGLLQIAVMWPAGKGGLVSASELAGEIIAHFAKGTKLRNDGFTVAIPRKGWTAPHLEEPGRVRLPISIPYECFSA